MILPDLLDCGIDDSIIAEGLSRRVPGVFDVILEAKLDVASFRYTKSKNDPKPKVLVLGKWQHSKTGNILVCGINLHYLNDEQTDALKQALPQIMTKDSLKAKYWEGMTLVPDIFKVAYRTYDQRFVRNVNKSIFEIPDAIPEPEQQDIEPFNKPGPEPERQAVVPPPPDSEPVDDDLGAIAEPNLDIAEPELDPSATPEPSAPEEPTLQPIDEPVAEPAAVEPSLEPEEVQEPEKQPEQPEKKEEPKEPAAEPKPKTRSILTKAKDIIKKLAGLISGKKAKNKQTAPEAKAAEPAPPSDADLAPHIHAETLKSPTDKDGEVEHLEQIERHERALEHEHDGMNDQIAAEGFEAGLDAILEQFTIKPRGIWHTPQEYIELHTLSNFFSYQHKLGSTVLECAQGTKFLAMYHIPTNRLIIDLADSYFEMLHESGWELKDTIRFTDGLEVLYEDHMSRAIAEDLLKSSFGLLLTEIATQG